MNSINLTKRIITSIPLILLLGLSFYYTYILIISLILISIISWIEFQGLISKIFKKKNLILNFYKLSFYGLFFIYLITFSSIIFSGIQQDNFRINMIYLFSICIFSDIGGLLFGKIFKGKKLTKISPNKTISGSIGSFMLSLLLVPIFYFLLNDQLIILSDIILITIFVSLSCQLGDLFISYLKRKAKVKDTGDILPGHGGLLDRIDGMLLAIPLGVIIWKFLINVT
tara:strand:+ start:235 stop:915 length:681 start_codon:yes stop_codon:yes gene_type:complete